MQYRDWLVRRKGGIGSSDAPVLVLKKVFGKTPLDVYLDKRTPVPDAIVEDDNPNFRRGHAYEPVAIDLLAKQLDSTVTVFKPRSDEERFRQWRPGDAGTGYQVWCGAHMYADFDGLTSDGWIIEVKSPLQRNVDRMKAEGVNDYYLVQCGHLAHVAQTMGTFAWPAGACKGVLLVLYEPENVDILVIRLPFDQDFSSQVAHTVESFWHNYIAAGQPPVDFAPPALVSAKKPEGKYTPVNGDAWQDAGARFRIAKDAKDAAEARYEAAAKTIEEAMRNCKLERVQLPDGQKFIASEQKGRRSLDEKLLRHEHPEIDWARYERQGAPFQTFRAYGAKDTGMGDDSIDQQVTGLARELDALPKRQLDAEHRIAVWDDLRARAELYVRMLRAEADDLDAKLMTAFDELAKAMKGGN